MFCKQVLGVFFVWAQGTMDDLVPLSRPLNEKLLRSHLKREIGHGEGRTMFSVDDAFQDCFVAWFRAPYTCKRGKFKGRKIQPMLKSEFALARNWKQRQLRDLGKDLSFKTALCDRPPIKGDTVHSPSDIHTGEDKPLSNRAEQSELEGKRSQPKYTAKPSPTMADNARRFSARILPKLGGQLRVDARLDLGENFPILEALSRGYTQTEIAECLGVSQATICNRLKKIAPYFNS